MRISSLATTLTLMTMVCFGCGGGGSSGGGAGSSGEGGGSSSAGGGSSGGGAGSSGGGGGSSGGASTSASKTDSTVSSKPLSIEGSWLFLGPTGPGHRITITSKSMKYKGTEEDWESSWTIKTYDNDRHQFQLVFDSGHGSAYPSGESFSATYDATETILSVQLAKGLDSYPELKSPGSCTEGSDNIPDCKLYMKLQEQ